MAFLNNIPYMLLFLFNVIVLVVIAFMMLKLSFRLFIVLLIHDIVFNLLNPLNLCDF